MKIILFPSREAADTLIKDINAYVGSTAIAEPTESDEGWAVIVPIIATTTGTFDLPAMISNKQFNPPAPLQINPAAIPDAGGTLAP